MLLIFMTTVYTIGSEMKPTPKRMDGHGRHHHRSPDRQIAAPDCSFLCRASPSIMFIYTVSRTIPVISGISPMLFACLLLVLASQAFEYFCSDCLTTVRLALSTASLWGDFFLHIGYEFSGYGNESCITVYWPILFRYATTS